MDHTSTAYLVEKEQNSQHINIMQLRELFTQIATAIEPIYGSTEAQAIARRLLEDGHGITRSELLLNPNRELDEPTIHAIQNQIIKLKQGHPVQHIVGFQEFMGRRFAVNPSVLIPRPETEELVILLITENCGIPKIHNIENHNGKKILDIGTGSGAIAITLALNIPDSKVDAWDVSPEALATAQVNATQLGAHNITFTQADILVENVGEHHATSPRKDILVENVGEHHATSPRKDILVENVGEHHTTSPRKDILVENVGEHHATSPRKDILVENVGEHHTTSPRKDILVENVGEHHATSPRKDILVENVGEHHATSPRKDILVENDNNHEKWDIIVSNPPYITNAEKQKMHQNVLGFEPHLALFVEDTDPLVFYSKIADFAAKNLTPKGKLYFEINQQFGKQTASLLKKNFENITIIKDIHDVDRIISCQLKPR